MKKNNSKTDQTANDRGALQKPKRADPTSENKGYNEKNPSQPEGAFHADSKKQPGISGKNKKERPVVPEKKLEGRRDKE